MSLSFLEAETQASKALVYSPNYFSQISVCILTCHLLGDFLGTAHKVLREQSFITRGGVGFLGA